MLQFLERRNQIRHGPAPAIQAPHQHDIDFAAARSSEQLFAQFALRRAGADLFDLHDDGPASLGGVFAHGADLQRQRLLIVRGNAGIKADPEHRGWPKTLLELCFAEACFVGISAV